MFSLAENNFLRQKWIVLSKVVFIGEKPNLRILFIDDCQSLWVIDDFGGMPAEP